MIENTREAWPHYGIENADIVYECPVEGSITRYMALFQDYSGMDRIGNVRSCRPYYVDFASEYTRSMHILENVSSRLTSSKRSMTSTHLRAR